MSSNFTPLDKPTAVAIKKQLCRMRTNDTGYYAMYDVWQGVHLPGAVSHENIIGSGEKIADDILEMRAGLQPGEHATEQCREAMERRIKNFRDALDREAEKINRQKDQPDNWRARNAADGGIANVGELRKYFETSLTMVTADRAFAYTDIAKIYRPLESRTARIM